MNMRNLLCVGAGAVLLATVAQAAFTPPTLTGPGTLVIRLDADTSLYDGMAWSLQRMRGHTVAVLAGSPGIERAFRRGPDRWQLLYNGDIECRLLIWAM